VVLILVGWGSAVLWALYALGDRQVVQTGAQLGQWDRIGWIGRAVLTVLNFGGLTLQGIGTFGWNDTPLPTLGYVVWLLGVGAMLALWLIAPRTRSIQAWVPAAVFGCGSLFVVLYTLASAFGWQGRYVIPYWSAALLLTVPALAAMGRHRRPAAVLVAVGVLALLPVQFVGVVWMTWRNMYGFAQINPRFEALPFPHGHVQGWHPHGGDVTVFALALLAVLLVAALLVTARPWVGREVGDSRRREPVEAL
jgi:hypothetical protein